METIMSMGSKIYFECDSVGNPVLVEEQWRGKNCTFVKRTPLTPNMSNEDLKGILNCKYGKVVSDNMRKDYITVHINGKVGIVFKHTIAAVFNVTGGDNAKIIQNSGVSMIVDESYSAIVKAVLS